MEGPTRVSAATLKLKSFRIGFVLTAVFLAGINLTSIANSLRTLSHVAVTRYQPVTKISHPRRPSIVLFGDSLTQRGFGEDGNVGWASLLAAAYTRRADVKNRGFGGYNTHHALHVWPEIEDTFEDPVLFATLFFGANDAALPGNPQHLSLAQYHDNLTHLIANMRAKQGSMPMPIFLFTPPPVDENTWAQQRNTTSSNRLNGVTKTHGDVVYQVAQEQQLPVVDTWKLLEGANPNVYPRYLSDGLHLNELGNRRIYEGFLEILQRDYPYLAPKTDLHPSGMPFLHSKWQAYF